MSKTKLPDQPEGIGGLAVHEIRDDTVERFPAGEIPTRHLWAYLHLLNEDCGSLSVGTTVYELLPKGRP